MSLLFAAAHPDRTRGLVLLGSYARRTSRPDYPIGLGSDMIASTLEMIETLWGPFDIECRIPSLARGVRFRTW